MHDRLSVALSVFLTLLAIGPSAIAAPVASVFGGRIACNEQNGVQFCLGDVTTRVESWDGVPLDVNLTLPPASQNGPFPLIVDLHGWGIGKGGGPFVERAQDGYVVLSYSARGFQQSCGLTTSRTADPGLANPDVCAERGWIHLGDARYEARDTQYLAGLLADEGLVIPDRIGVTGISYGGGQSMILAALRDRVMLPDGSLTPWRSPGGQDMTIAAAAPLIPWSDLVYALTPNGRTLDYRDENPFGSRGGIRKESWNGLLYTFGLATGFYAPTDLDPASDIVSWNARLGLGEPYDNDPLLMGSLAELTAHHSAYYIDDSVPPAPLFIYNAWTDDLFPVDEALRFWRKTKSKHPQADISLMFADGFGHPRAALGANGARPMARVKEFFALHLQGTAASPLPPFETYTQACNGASEEGPFTGTDWEALHPGEVRYRARGVQRFTSAGGRPETAALLDPLTGGPCRTVAADDDPGAATCRLPAATDPGYTLLGSPTVIAELATTSPAAQVAARLWDVGPDGMQTLISHTVYRPRSDNAGPQVFQLHPNGWYFAAGHVAKLELLGQSPPYVRPSNGIFAVTVSKLELRLPVREAPAGKTIKASAPTVAPPGGREPYGCALAPVSNCRKASGGSTLVIAARGTQNRLVWKMTKGAAAAIGDFGDPSSTTDYALCAYDASDRLVLGAVAPAGQGWKTARNGPRYTDRRLTTGVQSIALNAGPEGGSSITVAGKGARLGVPTLPLDGLPLTVQLASADGACWASSLATAQKNTSRLLKASGE